MMERKFTDDEIVKALEMCNYNADCDNCPCVGECWNVNKYAIDLINRQKAEIERSEGALKAEEQHNELTMEMAQKAIQNAKSEAIKEFAERLKAKRDAAEEFPRYEQVVCVKDIDTLVKEMTGENNGN